MLVFLEVEIAQRFLRAARDAFGAGELRHQQAAAAEAANDAAEERVRHAAMGASTAAGRMVRSRIWKDAGIISVFSGQFSVLGFKFLVFSC